MKCHPIQSVKNFLVALSLGLVILCFMWLLKRTVHVDKNNTDVFSPPSKEVNLLIIYVYYEADPHHTNFLFFLKHALHSAADFVLVLNGEVSEEISKALPRNMPNVGIIHRNNTCFDMGTYGEVLDRLEGNKERSWGRKYKYYIFMNASVKGPFMPEYVKSCWSSIFTNRLTDEVKMVGTTFNCRNLDNVVDPHIQSMLLAVDETGLRLIKPLFRCFKDWRSAVEQGELKLYNRIVSHGYKGDVLMTAFHNSPSYGAECNHADVYWPRNYYGNNIHPFEVIFFKTNRGVSDNLIDLYSGFMMKRNYSSHDYC